MIKNYLPIWDNLSKDEQTRLANAAITVKQKKDTTVFASDFQCVGMLMVQTGTLRVYMMSDDGKEISLYRISDGEICIMAAACVLRSITFDVYIEAMTDCEFTKIPSDVVSDIMKNNVYMEAFAYRLATERFSDVMWTMQQILFMSFDKRLAIFLLDETASLGSDTIKMTHEQIAKLLGSAREVVSRMLKYFAEEGYVALSRGTVTITNKKALRELTE